MASRVLPLPIPGPTPSATASSRPPSTDPGGGGLKPESSYTVRAIPVKIYLPDGAPVIQEVIPPLNQEGILLFFMLVQISLIYIGAPITVIALLHQHLSLLFPPSSVKPYPIAFPIAQGVELPPDAELAWLAACLCGADGWLRIGIWIRVE